MLRKGERNTIRESKGEGVVEEKRISHARGKVAKRGRVVKREEKEILVLPPK